MSRITASAMESLSLTSCPECGSLVPESAKTCLNCGAPTSSRPKLKDQQPPQAVQQLSGVKVFAPGKTFNPVPRPLLLLGVGAAIGIGICLIFGLPSKFTENQSKTINPLAEPIRPDAERRAAATGRYWKSLCEVIEAEEALEARFSAKGDSISKEFTGLARLPNLFDEWEKGLAGLARQVRGLNTTNVDAGAISYAMEVSLHFDEKADLLRKISKLATRYLDLNTFPRGWLRMLRNPATILDAMEGKVPEELQADWNLGNAATDRQVKEQARLAARKVELQAELVRKYNFQVVP